MGVKLRITGRQPRDQTRDIVLIHARVLQQAEDSARVFDVELTEDPARFRSEQPEKQRVAGAIEKMAGGQPQVQPEKIARQPEMGDGPLASAAHQNSKHRRMHVKVKVPVDMVELESGRVEFFKLSLDFPLHLRAQAFAKKVTNAGRNRAVAEISFVIDQAGNFTGFEGRGSTNQADVQADSEPRILPREFNCLVRRPAVYHQAGRGENAFAMGAEDGLVDGARPAEVVGVDDEPADSLRASHNSEPARR